jgi:hypothetical protein
MKKQITKEELQKLIDNFDVGRFWDNIRNNPHLELLNLGVLNQYQKQDYKSLLNSLSVFQDSNSKDVYWHYDDSSKKKYICLRAIHSKNIAAYDNILVCDINDLQGIENCVQFLRSKKNNE